MRKVRIIISVFGCIFLMTLGMEMTYAATTQKKELFNRLQSLERETIAAQGSTLELLDGVAADLSRRLRIQKKALSSNTSIKENLSVSKVRLADVEKARARLKRDITTIPMSMLLSLREF